jgi:hypothetical protein
MRICGRKHILFLFLILLIKGFDAFAQAEIKPCVLKVFVNDPYSQVYVDGLRVGTPPQLIGCSDKEKSIMVKSSDGQIFSRLMTSKNNFDLANSTLNVVFQKKASNHVYQTDVHQPKVYQSDDFKPEIYAAAKAEPVPPPLTAEILAPVIEPLPVQPIRDLATLSENPQHDTPIVTRLPGSYIQIFALKNLDMSRIEQDMQHHYNGRITQPEITVCPWENPRDGQILSLVLVGPYHKKMQALEARNAIGGKSFIVTDPTCKGDYTKVTR